MPPDAFQGFSPAIGGISEVPPPPIVALKHYWQWGGLRDASHGSGAALEGIPRHDLRPTDWKGEAGKAPNLNLALSPPPPSGP